MARRGGSARAVCTFDGCSEVGWLDYDSQKEYYERIAPKVKRYRCYRHHNDGLDVLSLENDRIITELEVENGTWRGARSGFVYGPGFQAYAKDFNPGAKIRITVEIIST